MGSLPYQLVHDFHWFRARPLAGLCAVVAAVFGLGILRPLRSQCYILALASSELPPAAYAKGSRYGTCTSTLPPRNAAISHADSSSVLFKICRLSKACGSLCSWLCFISCRIHTGFVDLLDTGPCSWKSRSHRKMVAFPMFQGFGLCQGSHLGHLGKTYTNSRERSGHKVRGHLPFVTNPNNS